VYTIAARITADHAVAEEVVQDVFQAVWQSAATFQPQSSFVGWLVGITRHRAIDATRSRRYRSRLYEDIFDDERLASAVRSEDGHDDALLLRFTMRAALDELPPAQRRTIELAYYGGLTHVEIAEQIGEPIGTIKSRLRLGLTKLRVLLGSFGFDERE
jgi:RNA polymerase sigma-70 factor (ECF subfamily)